MRSFSNFLKSNDELNRSILKKEYKPSYKNEYIEEEPVYDDSSNTVSKPIEDYEEIVDDYDEVQEYIKNIRSQYAKETPTELENNDNFESDDECDTNIEVEHIDIELSVEEPIQKEELISDFEDKSVQDIPTEIESVVEEKKEKSDDEDSDEIDPESDTELLCVKKSDKSVEVVSEETKTEDTKVIITESVVETVTIDENTDIEPINCGVTLDDFFDDNDTKEIEDDVKTEVETQAQLSIETQETDNKETMVSSENEDATYIIQEYNSIISKFYTELSSFIVSISDKTEENSIIDSIYESSVYLINTLNTVRYDTNWNE